MFKCRAEVIKENRATTIAAAHALNGRRVRTGTPKAVVFIAISLSVCPLLTSITPYREIEFRFHVTMSDAIGELRLVVEETLKPMLLRVLPALTALAEMLHGFGHDQLRESAKKVPLTAPLLSKVIAPHHNAVGHQFF